MVVWSAEKTLAYMIWKVTLCLEEIEEEGGAEKSSFLYGEKTAYVECLQALQRWEKATRHGLHGEVERRFPL